MKKLLSFVAIMSMLFLSLNAYSKLAANGTSLNGVSLNSLAFNKLSANGIPVNGVDQTLNIRSLAQAPLVKAD